MAMHLTEQWLNECVLEPIRLPAVSPQVAKAALPIVEYRLKKILQAAFKFYKNGNGSVMTVNDFNLALSLFREEEVYGLPSLAAPSSSFSSTSISSSHDSNNNTITTRVLATPLAPHLTTGEPHVESRNGDCDIFKPIRITDIAKTATTELKYPLLPELSVYWLVVEGKQPLIPENPRVVIEDGIDELPQEFTKELKHFYARVTSILLSEDPTALPAVYTALNKDPGLQILIPYFSRFIYQQVKAKSKTNVRLLMALMRSLRALILNEHLQVQFHIQQLLPAVFTCIVASKLSSSTLDDHWSLRLFSAELISIICLKYCHIFPDLHTRVCKTYQDALNSDKSLSAVYGGLAGLYYLGYATVKAFVIPNVQSIASKVTQLSEQVREVAASKKAQMEGAMDVEGGSSSSSSRKKPPLFVSENDVAVSSCKGILLKAIGLYISESLSLGVSLLQQQQQQQQADAAMTAPAPIAASAGRASKKAKTTPATKATPASKLARAPATPRAPVAERELFGLEEALVPYYASGAGSVYSCSSLFI